MNLETFNNKILTRLRIVSGLILFSIPLTLHTQEISESEADSAKTSIVTIDQADIVEKVRGRFGEEVLILNGNVLMHQDSLFMQCDSARKEGNDLVAVGNVLLQQWDSLNVFANRLEYFGDRNEAFLQDSVILQSKSQMLFTDTLEYNTATRVASYHTGATITNDTVFLFSLKGTFFTQLDEVYFKDSVYVKNEDFELFADTLLYNTAQQKAYFLGPTRIDLTDGSKVYCEAGYFDMGNKKALFKQNAEYLNEDQIALGDSILYDGELKKVTLLGNASLQEPGKKATADTIIYLEKEELLTLSGNAFFEDSLRTMESEALKYNIKEDKLSSDHRSNLDSDGQFLEADIIDFDNKTGLGKASGNIIWQDTASHYTIICDEAEYVDSSGYLKAFGNRPLLINAIDGDSLFLVADTLHSFEVVTPANDSLRLFRAFHDVEIFKSDLQAICDSLTYSSQDSTFHLYNDPLIWSDTSQFKADSISIRLIDNKVDKIYLKQKAFIINSEDHILYNQMKGKEITAFFKEGEIDHMVINGNAQSIYYVLDDIKAYIGVNETLCSNMLLRFIGNAVNDIVFYANPEAKFHPIQDADVMSLKLEGFEWRGDQRPTKEQVLSALWQVQKQH